MTKHIFEKAKEAYAAVVEADRIQQERGDALYEAELAYYRDSVKKVLRELYPDEFDDLLPFLQIPDEDGPFIIVPDSFDVHILIEQSWEPEMVISEVTGVRSFITWEAAHFDGDGISPYGPRVEFDKTQLLEAIGHSLAHMDQWQAAIAEMERVKNRVQIQQADAPPATPTAETPALVRIAEALEAIAARVAIEE